MNMKIISRLFILLILVVIISGCTVANALQTKYLQVEVKRINQRIDSLQIQVDSLNKEVKEIK